MKAVEQFFLVARFNVILAFQSSDKILQSLTIQMKGSY